jgi:hypothetical protein
MSHSPQRPKLCLRWAKMQIINPKFGVDIRHYSDLIYVNPESAEFLE